MADIRIKDLPTNGSPSPSQYVPTDLATTEKMTIQVLVDTGAPIASQAEAQAGVNATKRMTPLTTKQAIDVQAATFAQGALADTAVQPGDLSAVATTGNYNDLSNQPSLSADLIYPVKADAVAATIPSIENALRINGSVTEGDGLGGLYIDTNNGNPDTFVSSGGTSRTWYRAPDRFQADINNQSGGGTTATTKRELIQILYEPISSYNYIPENIQADIRTGLLSTSLTPYFAAAVTHLNPSGSNIPGGAKVNIPRGKYLIDGVGIPMQDSIEWIGENKEGTRIQAMGDNPIFASVGTSANQVGRAAVKNMTLVGDGKAHLHGYGIELVWMNNPLIEDVQFQALRWNIVQEYVVNAFIFGCSSNGTSGTIRGYLWKKAIDSTLFAGFDNTTTISDCYFMAGDIAMVLHGSNGIQMGGNVAMLQGGVRVGAIAETLADGTPFTPGATNDVIHFQHWDGLRLDTVLNDRAIRVVKGAMGAPHDFRLSSLWAGNVTGTNSYVCDFDGLEDFSITGGNIDVTGQTPFWFNNCKRGNVSGVRCAVSGAITIRMPS